MIKEVKILEVHVDKGMKHGQRITFAGEADQAPGVEPGDIVLLLQEKEHEVMSLMLALFRVGVACKVRVRCAGVSRGSAAHAEAPSGRLRCGAGLVGLQEPGVAPPWH